MRASREERGGGGAAAALSRCSRARTAASSAARIAAAAGSGAALAPASSTSPPSASIPHASRDARIAACRGGVAVGSVDAGGCRRGRSGVQAERTGGVQTKGRAQGRARAHLQLVIVVVPMAHRLLARILRGLRRSDGGGQGLVVVAHQELRLIVT